MSKNDYGGAVSCANFSDPARPAGERWPRSGQSRGIALIIQALRASRQMASSSPLRETLRRWGHGRPALCIKPVHGGIRIPDRHSLPRRKSVPWWIFPSRWTRSDPGEWAVISEPPHVLRIHILGAQSEPALEGGHCLMQQHAKTVDRDASHLFEPLQETGSSAACRRDRSRRYALRSPSSGTRKGGLPVMPSELVFTTVAASSNMLPACTQSTT